MENFSPAYVLQKNRWIPALKGLKMPVFALLGLIALESTHKYTVPVGEPIGIINKAGVCYLASAIQLLDAGRFAIQGALDGVFQSSGSPMVEAYCHVHQDFACRDGISCIDPEKLIKIWVEKNPEIYKKPFIVRQTEECDGSLHEEELFPELVGNGSGGDPSRLVFALLTELGSRCKTLKKSNPFHIQFSGRHGKPLDMNFVWYDVSGETDQKDSSDFVHVKGDVVRTNHPIVKAPRLLVMAALSYHAHVPSLHITLRDKSVSHSYKLLGIIYGLPMIVKPQGFIGDHAIAVVRYGDRWYECDNHRVQPYATRQEVVDMMDRASRVRYEGSGIPKTSIPFKYPMVMMYELQ